MTLKILPTMKVAPAGQRTRTYLTIGVMTADGHTPVSTFRSMDVGVGGKHTFCTIAPGEPVRRATLAELRQKDRANLAKFLAQYPGATPVVYRSHH